MTLTTDSPLPFHYPDGPHNAESLLVHPVTGRLYVITKLGFGKHSHVYRFGETPTVGGDQVLTHVAEMQVPGPANFMATAGDFSPCGDRMLLRTYDTLFELTLPEGASDPEAIFTAPAREVPVGNEKQGEAVAYRLDGLGYVTTSECAGNCGELRLQEVTCP